MVYRQRQKRLSWSGVSSLTWSPDDKTLAIGSGLSIAQTKRLSLPKMTNECRIKQLRESRVASLQERSLGTPEPRTEARISVRN